MILNAQSDEFVRLICRWRPTGLRENSKANWKIYVFFSNILLSIRRDLEHRFRRDFESDNLGRGGEPRMKDQKQFNQFALDRIQLCLKNWVQHAGSNRSAMHECQFCHDGRPICLELFFRDPPLEELNERRGRIPLLILVISFFFENCPSPFMRLNSISI